MGDLATLLTGLAALLAALGGIGGTVYVGTTGRRREREDSARNAAQQMLDEGMEMRVELRTENKDLRTENKDLRAEVERLRLLLREREESP